MYRFMYMCMCMLMYWFIFMYKFMYMYRNKYRSMYRLMYMLCIWICLCIGLCICTVQDEKGNTYIEYNVVVTWMLAFSVICSRALKMLYTPYTHQRFAWFILSTLLFNCSLFSGMGHLALNFSSNHPLSKSSSMTDVNRRKKKLSLYYKKKK